MAVERRKQRIGTVISDKADKTITVGVSWRRRDPIYRKQVRRITKFMAHDEDNRASLGDTVRIEETRPLSARKRWRLVDIIGRGDIAEIQPHELDLEPGATPPPEESE